MALKLAKDPTGKEPDPSQKGKEPAKGEPKPEPQSILEMKLDGDGVADELKGKTIGELITMMASTQGELTKTKQENKQWQEAWEDANKQKQTQTGGQKDPMMALWEEAVETFGEPGAKIVAQLAGARIAPVLQGLAGIHKVMAKDMYPDFEEHEEDIDKVVKQMTLEQMADPNLSYYYAYKQAKMHKTDFSPPPKDTPKVDPSDGGPKEPVEKTPEYTDEEKKWQKITGVTPEEYEKYMEVQETPKQGELPEVDND